MRSLDLRIESFSFSYSFSFVRGSVAWRSDELAEFGSPTISVGAKTRIHYTATGVVSQRQSGVMTQSATEPDHYKKQLSSDPEGVIEPDDPRVYD